MLRRGGFSDQSGGTAASTSSWVVIPAANEAATIADVVTGASTFADGVIVVDDASSDDTARTAEAAGATVIRLAVSLGAWGATQTGMRYALEQGAECVVTMDGDGQHVSAEVPVLLDALDASVDVVIGAAPERVSWQRRLAWTYLRMLSGSDICDLTSGFRVYRRQAVRILAGDQAILINYQDLGVLLLLKQNGFDIREVSVRMAERVDGRSRIFRSWWVVARYLMESTVIALSGVLWRQRLQRVIGR